jgi:cytoskeletal protein CcmA (bactofilin family)
MQSPFHLFGRNEAPDWTGFLDRETRIDGTLEAPGTFRFDGTLEGRIRSSHLLVLGETAEVRGEIEGERVAIYGHFRGTLRAGVRVEIHSRAEVTGDIYTPCLVLEPGGHFDGHCYLNPAGAQTDPLLVPIRGVAEEEPRD